MTIRLQELYQKRDEILDIASRHGAKNLRVFGSVAREEAQSESDLDFLVDFEKGRSLFDLGGLCADFEDYFGCKVDIVSENGLNPRFKDNILRDAVPL